MWRWGILLCALPALLSACFEPALPRGDHLGGPGGGGIFGSAPLAPAEEAVVMIDRLENRSDEPLTIKSIEPYGMKNFGRVAEVVSIEVGPRPATGLVVVMGSFDVYPPAELRPGGRCVVQPTEPPAEFRLPPGDVTATVAVRYRTIAPGVARTDGLRIVYEVGGERYEHHTGGGVRLRVKEDHSYHVDGRLRRACADRVEPLR